MYPRSKVNLRSIPANRRGGSECGAPGHEGEPLVRGEALRWALRNPRAVISSSTWVPGKAAEAWPRKVITGPIRYMTCAANTATHRSPRPGG